MIGTFQINEHAFHPNGYRKLTEGFINFEVSDRTINNTLVSDFLAVKKTFTISWDDCTIDGDLLEEFIEWSQSSNTVTFALTNNDLTITSTICRLKMSDTFTRVYEKGKYAYSGIEVYLEEV